MADREIPWGSGLLNPPSGGQNYGGRLDPTLVDEEEMNPDSYNVMANLNLPTSFSPDQVGVSSGGPGGDWEDTKRLARNNVSMEVFVDGLKEGRISEAELEQAIESGAELIRGRPRIIAVAALAKFRRDKGQYGNALGGEPLQYMSQPPGRGWDYHPDALAEMAGPIPETFSETIIEEKNQFGPSSDEEAVKQQFRAVLADGTVGDLRQYIEMNIGDLELLAQTDNSIAKDLEAALRFLATGDQSRFQGVSPDQTLQTWDEAFQADQNIPQKTYQSPPASGAAFASPGGFDPYAYMEGLSPGGEMTPDVLPREEFMPFQTAPEFAHGGYVGRGTMAGELGRRGDLSVREAGETMYERNKRLHGYDRGGYVHGRGTMPGELHPKGSLSVRVAGESMGEYKKHREDEDEVSPVRRTLSTALSPTLSRRMFS